MDNTKIIRRALSLLFALLLLDLPLASAHASSRTVEITISVVKFQGSLLEPGQNIENLPLVNVIGSVNVPQAVPTKIPISVLEAITAAGGFSRSASQTGFQISTIDGYAFQYRGPLFHSPEGRELCSRIMVKPGEVLYISERDL